MRSEYFEIAQTLKNAQEKLLEPNATVALQAFGQAIQKLRLMPPERLRDALLAHAHLGRYRTLNLNHDSASQKAAHESLNLGVSYARTSKDPTVRAMAEHCLSELEPEGA